MSECFLLKNQYKNPREVIRASVLGFAVGDALGVPVEFLSREELEQHPLLRQAWSTRSHSTRKKRSSHRCCHPLRA